MIFSQFIMKEQRKKIIKNKLHQDLGSELDIDLAWSEFKQKKRLVFWWPALGGVMIILGFFFVNKWNRPIDIDTKKQITETTTSTNSIEKVIKSPLPTTPNVEARINNQAVTLITEGEGKSITKTKNAKTKIVDPKTIQLDKSDLNTTLNPSQKPQVAVIPTLSSRSNSTTIKGSISSFIIEQKALQKITKTNSQLFDTPLNQTKKDTRLLSEVRMLLTPLTLLKLKASELPPLPLAKQNPQMLWALGITYQYSKIGRTIKGENIHYLDRRNFNEDFLESNHIAIKLRRQLKKGFYLQFGIHLSRYRAKLVDQYQTFEHKVFENQVVEIIQNGLQEESIIGSVTGTQTQIHTNTRFQQYLELSLPLQLGWQIPLNQRLSIDLMTGARFSIWNKTSGYTFESATSIGTYQMLDELRYKKAGVITGVSSLLLSQQIGRGTTISAGIQAYYDWTNRLSDKSESDKFYGYGLQISLLKQLKF